jgi:hypothetical protein
MPTWAATAPTHPAGAGGGHHRPSRAAAEGHLVPGHQPAPPQRTPRRPGPHPPADLADSNRLYSLRPWIEQSYKQIKDELGWADFQFRSARAIRRNQTLVNCASSICWG